MKRFLLSAPAGLALVALSLAAVVVYNAWAYCCGRCSMEALLIPSPVGMTLIAANGAALAALVVLRRRRARGRQPSCRCGTVLAKGWHFCPACGQPAGRENPAADEA